MGREVQTGGHLGGLSGQVRAHLDGVMLQLRGAIRADLSLADLSEVRVEGDWLHTQSPQGPLALLLGAREAALWQKRITAPPGLGDKLGLKAGAATAWRLGRPDDQLDALLNGYLAESAAAARLHFIALSDTSDFDDLAAHLSEVPTGAAVWTLRPKGKAPAIPESALRATMAALGWTATKTASFSAERSADRWHRTR